MLIFFEEVARNLRKNTSPPPTPKLFFWRLWRSVFVCPGAFSPKTPEKNAQSSGGDLSSSGENRGMTAKSCDEGEVFVAHLFSTNGYLLVWGRIPGIPL